MLSESYIMKLVEKYAKSPAGKAEIKKQTGITYTEKNPSAELIPYGEQMKMVLYKYIHELIRSITPDDIIVEKPYQDVDGLWKLKLSFREGALHRDSLYEDEYDGVNNIVLLFAKGYHARDYAYGHWWLPNQTWYGAGDFVNVRSRKDRDGNDFLIRAVSEFNRTIGKDFAHAELLGAYKDCSENPN